MSFDVKKILQELSDLEEETIDILIENYKYAKYPGGTILSSPGVRNTAGGILLSGICKIYQTTNAGKEYIFNFNSAPGFVAYSASSFFVESPSQIYCQSITEIEVMEIQADVLFDLANKKPDIYTLLLKVITEVYQKRQIKEFSIIEKSSKERYLDFLERHSNFIDVIPLKSIASYLSIQPGSLSRLRKGIKS